MNFLFLGLPLFVWGGFFIFILIVLQILTGLNVIKLRPIWHTKIIWKIIIIFAIFHGFLGIFQYL